MAIELHHLQPSHDDELSCLKARIADLEALNHDLCERVTEKDDIRLHWEEIEQTIAPEQSALIESIAAGYKICKINEPRNIIESTSCPIRINELTLDEAIAHTKDVINNAEINDLDTETIDLHIRLLSFLEELRSNCHIETKYDDAVLQRDIASAEEYVNTAQFDCPSCKAQQIQLINWMRELLNLRQLKQHIQPTLWGDRANKNRI